MKITREIEIEIDSNEFTLEDLFEELEDYVNSADLSWDDAAKNSKKLEMHAKLADVYNFLKHPSDFIK
jgi:hypothetical protein